MNVQSISQYIARTQPSMVKGMTRMSKRELRNHAYRIVSDYAVFNKEFRQYDLIISDLPDFVRHEFASVVLSYDEDYANEANGSDNPAFLDTMLPALTRFLTNTTDKDLEIEFTNAWRDGVTNYMTSYMQELIDESLEDYNSDIDCNDDSHNVVSLW